MEAFDRLARQIPLVGDRLVRLPGEIKAAAQDVHLKAGQPVALCGREGVFFLRQSGVTRAITPDLPVLDSRQITQIFEELCGFSVFAHEEELRRGFLEMKEGARVGVFGRASVREGQVITLREVTGLVFRVPREVPGCGDRLFLEGADPAGGLLIVGEPASGKTTLLRDVIRSLARGKFQPVRRVAVIDPRGELGWGEDPGPCADVLTGYPKAAGFDVALRCLGPEVLVCDELGEEDLPGLRQAVHAGVGVVAAVHGDPETFSRRPLIRSLLDTGAFPWAALLEGRTRPGELRALQALP